jgi:DNA primase
MAQTVQDLQATGIQGEETNMQILWYVMTSRKSSDPLSLICLARSGTGKSYLMEKVAGCIPEEDRREHTQFSGNSLYYFRREEIKGTVFLIEDLDGAQAVMFPIRELQSKKRISKTVTVKARDGQLKTVTLIVEGPVSVIGCTTQEKVYEDNANRSILIYLDDSSEQDERVMHYQKQLRAKLVNRQQEKLLQAKLQNMQRVLEPVLVVNPYAVLIDLPREIFKPRRSLPLLLGFMEAIAFYHQYQRECKRDALTAESYIEVHPQDVEAAFTLLQDVLFRKSDELSTATRDFYECLRSFVTDQQVQQFYGSDIRKRIRIHPRTLSRYLQELTEFGLLQITGGNRHRTGYSYTINVQSDFKALQDSISSQVATVMQKIWEAHHERIKQVKLPRQRQVKNIGSAVSQ